MRWGLLSHTAMNRASITCGSVRKVARAILARPTMGDAQMTIASIMVSLDLGATAAARVRLAASLADRFEATLTGVAARKIPDPGPGEDLHTIQAAYKKEQA